MREFIDHKFEGITPAAEKLLRRFIASVERVNIEQERLREEEPVRYFRQLFPDFADPRSLRGLMLWALMEMLAERNGNPDWQDEKFNPKSEIEESKDDLGS